MRHHNKGINKTGSNTAAQHTSNYIRGYKAVALVIRQRRRSRENMNEQNKIKVKDMTYSRIDIDDECEAFRRLTERVRTAKSGKELADIRSETIERTKHIRTMNSLCYIRFTMNTRDEYYLSEKTYYDENMPKLTAIAADFNRAFLSSPYLSDALGLINPNVAKVYELALKVSDEKIVPLMAEEAALVTEYDRLMSEMDFRFRGKKMPFSVLRKYFDDPCRDVRRKAMEIAGRRMEKDADALDGLFDKLVKVRARMAKEMDLPSYAVMGDMLMGRYSYGRREIGSFRREIAENVTPLVAELKTEIARGLGIDRVMLYDNETYFADGNPEPAHGPEGLFDAAKRMYHDMSREAGEFIDEMLAADAFDVFARDGKWGGGYCTAIDDYGQPFILANFNGSSGDVDVLTHEAGHALAYYEMFRSGADYELELGTMSVAEIHSMAMEFFAWKYAGSFFGEHAEKYKRMHLMSSLTFLPYGTQVDEFQETCYENPTMTPAERNELWRSLDAKYRPYLSAEGLPYFERGTRWQYQMHIYENPMYYIDYCLSQTVAHRFLLMSLENYDDAFARYMKLLRVAGGLPFGELVESVGIADPLKGGALTENTRGAIALLDRI